jgi:dipeptidyl aminopeptidase/acylaminoacyl peptidase
MVCHHGGYIIDKDYIYGNHSGVKEREGSGGNLDQSSRVQCVVDWFGPASFADFKKGDQAASAVSKLLGGLPEERKEKAIQASPTTYVAKDNPPFLIVHGEADRLVPIKQSEILDEALRKAGVECTFIRIPGEGHGGRTFENAENLKKIEEFFDKHLRAPRAGA